MSETTSRHIAIAGAGLGGALMACYLARMGYRVSVWEYRPDPRAAGFRGGRSINLALSARGIDALQRVGLAEPVLADAVRMPGRMLHAPSGDLTFQPYSADPQDAINSVSRGGLNITLLNAAAQHENVSLHFDQRTIDVDLDAPALLIEDTGAGEQKRIEADLVIGADGAFSAVRSRLQKTDRFEYSQQYLEHGYKELHIPPTASGEFAMEPHALHIWPRKSYMMIALPNADRSFTCTLFWPFAGPNGFEQVQGDDVVLRYFKEHFPDAVPLMPTLLDDYRSNPVSSLVTVRCAPWHHEGKVVLLGDAAHAVVPFYGQGMNAAFEDCRALAECIEQADGDFSGALPAYTARRVENANAIADMALDNFIEMRDRTGSRAFLLKKKLEQTLHRLFPDAFMPLYNMVSFSTIPYAEARDRARRQAKIIRRIGVLASFMLVALFFILLWVILR